MYIKSLYVIIALLYTPLSQDPNLKENPESLNSLYPTRALLMKQGFLFQLSSMSYNKYSPLD
jgi:hypothetical protein